MFSLAEPPSAPADDGGVAAEPRVLVLQMGARLHYGVPAVYARANALQGLYTDACASVGVLAIARRVLPPPFRSPGLHRLLGRTLPPEIPREAVHVATLSTLTERFVARAARKSGAIVLTHERLRRRILRERFGGANCLCCVDNADLDLMKAAREAGLTVLYRQLILPSVGRILREERQLFPGIEPQIPEDVVERGVARDREVFELADAVICASTRIAEDIASLVGPAARTAVVPYGIRADWLQAPRAPVPGRILFVGSVGLRKGNHYLAEAARLLKSRGVPCDVRVVGPFDPRVIARPEFRGPTYVGQVPRDVVRSEFAQADVLTLPTLADGFGIVHLEALACGVPVVTTANCGSQVRDGEDGFIVPVRDAAALADRLEQIVTDRALRERMSRAASEHARELNLERHGRLLLAATRDAMLRAAQRRAGG